MAFPAASLHVRLGHAPLPYCTEYAPFLWGDDVNYDSDGNAYNEDEPTHWTILDISNRQTNERLLIRPRRNPDDPPSIYRDAQGQLHISPANAREEVTDLLIEDDDPVSVRCAAYLTAFRSQGRVIDPQTDCEISLDEIYAAVADMEARVVIANSWHGT